MTDETDAQYVTLENYRKGVAAALIQGKTLGILTALTDYHKDHPEIKEELMKLRSAFGDDNK